ncbi:hypothetical protein ACFPK5_07415 [Streptomyces beijiangensis]|uniref:hypothetical protein n=1 Tax=Streptomyces beijiangensis TaxID=163361 RepID=UPI00360B0999
MSITVLRCSDSDFQEFRTHRLDLRRENFFVRAAIVLEPTGRRHEGDPRCRPRV